MKLPRLLILPLALLLAFTCPSLSLAQKKSSSRSQTVSRKSPKAGKTRQTTTKSTRIGTSTSKGRTRQVATKAPAKKGATKAAPSRSTAAKRGAVTHRRPVPRRPATQQQPTEDRVRDIQQALTDKGYPVEVSGVWGPQSMEALKKFQEDQNINNMSGRGKLDSLTLIALGLGPKREPPPTTPAPAQPKATTEGQIP